MPLRTLRTFSGGLFLVAVAVTVALPPCPVFGEERRPPVRYAYATVVTTENYVKPAMVMGASLTAHAFKVERRPSLPPIDRICLTLTSDVAGGEGAGVSPLGVARLEAAGWTVRPIPFQIMNPNYVSDEGTDEYGAKVHVWNYNKLWVWSASLMQYDRVVYLDSDILVLKDLNRMFDMDVWTDRGAPANATHRNFAAAPDTIPPDKFNSGVMLLRPSESTFDDMLDAIRTQRLDSYNRGDQGFLNAYYADWYAMPSSSRLPTIYNVPYSMSAYGPAWEKYLPDMRVVHFYGDRKPWQIIELTGDPETAGEARVAAGAHPLLYLWAGLSHLAEKITGDFESEARYLCVDVFDIKSGTDGSNMSRYMKEAEVTGKRRKRRREKAKEAPRGGAQEEL